MGRRSRQFRDDTMLLGRRGRCNELGGVNRFFQAEDCIRDYKVTGVQTCALPISAEILYRYANLVLAVSALGVATLIVAAIGRRRAWQPEPLGVVFCLVFLAIGVRAAVRVWTGSVAVATPGLVGGDWLAAGAAGGVLSPHAPGGGVLGQPGGGRGYAEKERHGR